MSGEVAAKSGIRWLVLGALSGLIAVGAGMLRSSNPTGDLPDGVVARVNDQVISRDTYERALGRLRADSSNAVDDQDESWVLQRLIEEELLVQRGLSLGMAQSELDVRGAIVQSLVASVTAEADAADPDEATLRDYYEANPERYSYLAALAVDAWTTTDEASARAFLESLADGRTRSDAVTRMRSIPAGPVAIDKLRDYLGPAITAAAARMPADSSAIFAHHGRWLVLRVVGKQDATLAEFDSVRARVLLDYRRSLADDLLRDYLDTLMDQADVIVANP